MCLSGQEASPGGRSDDHDRWEGYTSSLFGKRPIETCSKSQFSLILTSTTRALGNLHATCFGDKTFQYLILDSRGPEQEYLLRSSIL